MEPVRTEEQRLANLPEVLQSRISLPDRPIGERAKKRQRTQAQVYSTTNHYQPKIEDLNPGELCILLAPDPEINPSESCLHHDHLSFRIELGTRGQYSRLLYLGVVESVDIPQKQVTWVYVGPRKMTDKKKRRMAHEVAANPSNWLLVQDSKQTADWIEDEMILNWEKGKGEKGWCMPAEQYKDTVKVLTAMEEVVDEENYVGERQND